MVNLDEPGTGVGFVVSLAKVFGIAHMLCEYDNPSQEKSEPKCIDSRINT